MQDEFKLKRIKMYDYPNCDYKTAKEMLFRSFKQYVAEGCTVIQAVNGTYHYGISHRMDENGMDKFVAMIAGMLFMLEHHNVEADQAYGTYYDILDFETGEYDDLFTEEDLKQIRSDILLIKDHVALYPELLEEE